MKNSSNNNGQKLNQNLLNVENELLSTLTIEDMITEQPVAPPAYMWDRIEQVLNQQDDRIATANDIIHTSFKSRKRMSFLN